MMKMRFVAFFCLSLLLFFVAAPCAAQVCLNEILADPASDWNGDGEVNSRTDEWIEIVNTGSSTVDLSAYRIGDLSGGMDYRFAFSGTLGAGGILVVYGSEVVQWQSDNGVSTYGLSLNNSGDTVSLYRISGTDTAVVDDYAYGAHEVQDDRAVGRRPDGSGAWVLFDGLNPYSGTLPPESTGCLPSPGAPTACTTPTVETTWGEVKSLYKN
jgi:hypothetical protein